MTWTVEVPFHRQLGILNDLRDQTDRGLVIMVGAFIDRRLYRALRSRMHRDKEIENRFFGSSGPLGRFMARADLGFMLGLYDRTVRDEMLIISYIRNRFAHIPYPLDFGDKKIGQDCNNLRLPTDRIHLVHPGTTPPKDPTEPRERFIYSAQIILAELLQRVRDPVAPPTPAWRGSAPRTGA